MSLVTIIFLPQIIQKNELMRELNIDRVPPDLLPNTEFIYPIEEMTEPDKKVVHEFILHLLVDVINSRAPKTYLMALAYVYGINLEQITGTKDYNSLEKVAKVVGVRKQSLHDIVVRIKKKHQFSSHQSTEPFPHL